MDKGSRNKRKGRFSLWSLCFRRDFWHDLDDYSVLAELLGALVVVVFELVLVVVLLATLNALCL